MSSQSVRTGKSIVLIGLMGAGKTCIGRRLARRLQMSFVDADEEIVKAAGAPVVEIFRRYGESAFRESERRVIARLLNGAPLVLATGGGAFMNPETRANIKRHGVSIWLRAELPVLMKRVLKRDTRPLLQTGDPEAVMCKLMDARYPVYQQAELVIESRDVPHETIVAEIIEALAASPALAAPRSV